MSSGRRPGALQREVQDVLDELVADGETGLQVAVLRNGEVVVDAVGRNDPEILRADVPSVGTVTHAASPRCTRASSTAGWSTPRGCGSCPRWRSRARTGSSAPRPRLALGFPLGRIGAAAPSSAFGWPVGGGSYAYADPATGVAFALTKNRLTPHFDAAQRVADRVDAAVRRS